MNKDFTEYQEALDLKQLGYNEPCLGYWRNENKPNPLTVGQYTTKEDMEYEISGQDECHNFKNIIALAPTYSQAFRWFRENYPHLNFGFDKIHPESENYHYHINYKWEFFEGSYEEAELECLKKLIEIVKENNK
jgi:hypothetical protein